MRDGPDVMWTRLTFGGLLDDNRLGLGAIMRLRIVTRERFAAALGLFVGMVAGWQQAEASGACCTLSKGRSGEPTVSVVLSAARSHEHLAHGRYEATQTATLVKGSFPVNRWMALQAHVGTPVRTEIEHGGIEASGSGGLIWGGGVAFTLPEVAERLELSASLSYTTSIGEVGEFHMMPHATFAISEVQALLVAETRVGEQVAVYGGLRFYNGRSRLEDPDEPDLRGEREGNVGALAGLRFEGAGRLAYVAEVGFGHTRILSAGVVITL